MTRLHRLDVSRVQTAVLAAQRRGDDDFDRHGLAAVHALEDKAGRPGAQQALFEDNNVSGYNRETT